MSESLIQLLRVGDDGYFGCKTLSPRQDDDISLEMKFRTIRVPASAVRPKKRALVRIIGCKTFVGGLLGCI